MQMDTKFPTDEEIWEIYQGLLGDSEFTERRKLADAHGVYLWEIQTNATDGGTFEYSYMRKGSYSEGVADVSRIDRVYLDAQDNPVGGDSIAKFIDGRWVVL